MMPSRRSISRCGTSRANYTTSRSGNCSAAKCATPPRVYGHGKGRTRAALVAEAVRLKSEGFTALLHLNPLLDDDETTPYFKSHAQKIEDAAETVRQLRDAGPVNGFMPIPNGPGIGVELMPDARERFPERPRPIWMRPHHDGSVVNM